MMKFPKLIQSSFLFALLVFYSNHIDGQIVYFFTEGTDNTFYDQGIVDIANLGQSFFEHTSPPGAPQWNDKVPCSTTSFKGGTSLKFNYISSSTGNWKATIYRKDWTTTSINTMDSLSFFIYAENQLPSSALPLIGLKAINLSGTGEIDTKLYPLAGYNGPVQAKTWTKIRIPVSVIINDPLNNQVDFASIKGVIFNQSETDQSSRQILIDQVLAFKNIDKVPDIIDFKVTGYDSHAELMWTFPMNDLSYRVYASFDGGQTYQVRTETESNDYLDFVPESARNSTVLYRLKAFYQEKESPTVESAANIKDCNDDGLLDLVQRYSFRYFWEGAHQQTGMALERTNDDTITVASGATGMGLMAMIVAYEREFHAREQIKDRILKILNFLATCQRHHGAWSHWYYANTFQTKPFSTKDDGGDLVETSYVATALMALRNYFSDSDSKSIQIRENASTLLNGIEWEWYRQGNQNVLYWHWSPNFNFDMNMPLKGWDEALITYLMAASSTSHGISKEVYDQGWASNGNMASKRTYYNYDINLSPDWGGPLFWIHYSFLGIDPHGLKDQYADYWQENINTAKIHYAYAVANPKGHVNYGSKCWGLTASDDPYGYTAHQPMSNDNGTISPTAALSSMPYTPIESKRFLKYLYRERGKDLFGKYGPFDAFNDNLNWVKEAYIGIDQGPIVIMIENYRTGLIWKNVMKDADLQSGLNKLAMTFEITSIDKNLRDNGTFKSFPNPSDGHINLNLTELNNEQDMVFKIYNTNGKLVKFRAITKATFDGSIDCTDLPNGLYLAYLLGKNIFYTTELIIQK
jgi:hypothetical protein